MPRERLPVANHDPSRLRPERFRHTAGDQHAAERLVAAGDALGEGEKVGPDAETLAAEPAAEPAEADDDRVDHEEAARLGADRRDLRAVARNRRVGPPR